MLTFFKITHKPLPTPLTDWYFNITMKSFLLATILLLLSVCAYADDDGPKIIVIPRLAIIGLVAAGIFIIVVIVGVVSGCLQACGCIKAKDPDPEKQPPQGIQTVQPTNMYIQQPIPPPPTTVT
ncbi:hypothetical protein BJ138DRAFT_1141424 [Hygrophoropsis aurantiaca]|uniref:Uncharacterized protein n=1 Tax=Hygrophoropsis aurantiaca TaxID=72124 RepID=A0ACB8AR26_9AGAM|nr:hypothetical protein BJ138DRAFT_1141424 [Hygrophoropsis aurantiaca]